MKISFYPKPFKSSSNCTKCFTVKVRLFKTTWELNEKLFSHTLNSQREKSFPLETQKPLPERNTTFFVCWEIYHSRFYIQQGVSNIFCVLQKSHKIKLTTTQTWISIEKRHHFESLVHLIANHRWNSYIFKLFN